MEHDRNDGHKRNLRVLIQPNTGEDSDIRHSVVKILNHTLADEAVLSQKTRCAHWNLSGAGFFELYALFDIQYNKLNAISNEIAERVRMLGGITIGSFEEFINFSRVEEQPGMIPDILRLLADHEAAIRFLREDAKRCSEEYEDEVTRNFLVDILRQHEKMAWMLRSCIEPELSGDENKGSNITQASYRSNPVGRILDDGQGPSGR